MPKVENSSYHQFLVRRRYAINKRKEAQVLNRFEQALPRLQRVIEQTPKGCKWINLGEMQRVYHV